jgi:predicted DNA-binding transcriptional regulator AlpA
MPRNLLRERQVAEWLRVSPSCLRMWRHRDWGPKYIKIGRSVRYRPEAVDEFIAEHYHGTGPLSAPDPRIQCQSSSEQENVEPPAAQLRR